MKKCETRRTDGLPNRRAGICLQLVSFAGVIAAVTLAVAQAPVEAPVEALLPPGSAPALEPALPTNAGSVLRPDVSAAGIKVKDVEVRFTGTARVDEARVRSRMRLKEGETWTQEKEDDDLKDLYASGDFISASIDRVPVADGIKVIVNAEARPAMGDLEFRGNTVFNSKKLREEVEFRAGEVVDDAKLGKAKEKILEKYKEEGYPDTIVTYTTEQGANGFSTIIINVDEGGRGVIDGVQFKGNTIFSARRLRSAIKSDDRNWLKVWDLKRRLDRETVEKDMDAIREIYGNAGYFDANVSGVDSIPSGKKVTIVFNIVEGQQYQTGGVSITGNRAFDTATLLPVFNLEAGRTFSLGDMKADMELIQEYYGAHGYAEARVTPRIDKKDNQIFITYAIEEGQQFKVGKINIIGNEDTRQDVLRREMAIDPGDDWNAIKIRKSIQRLKNLEYFEDNTGVDFMPVTSDLGPEYKDLDITVKEQKTGSLQFGAGFSSIDSLVGMIELTQRNFDITNWPRFTGGGQRFKINIRAGSRRKDFLLSLTEPYFMGQQLSLGGDLFYTEKLYLSDFYDQRDTGATINMRKPISDSTELRLSYTFQQVEIYDVEENAIPFLDEEGNYAQSRLSAAVVFDNRDNLRLPARGHKITGELMYSGGVVGGEVDTYSISLSAQKHWRMPWNMIFSLESSLSVVDSTDGDYVPIFERKFLGGAQNLRGFRYRDVSPKDTQPGSISEGEPVGGKTAGYMTAEVSFPIFGQVRGVAFVDGGFVNEDAYDFSSSGYNSDAGIGLRFKLPIFGPIKLDYAIPLESDTFNDNSGRVQFSMDHRW